MALIYDELRPGSYQISVDLYRYLHPWLQITDKRIFRDPLNSRQEAKCRDAGFRRDGIGSRKSLALDKSTATVSRWRRFVRSPHLPNDLHR
jgi:hypothetical protein